MKVFFWDVMPCSLVDGYNSSEESGSSQLLEYSVSLEVADFSEI
jgi:hypothetical protein